MSCRHDGDAAGKKCGACIFYEECMRHSSLCPYFASLSEEGLLEQAVNEMDEHYREIQAQWLAYIEECSDGRTLK